VDLKTALPVWEFSCVGYADQIWAQVRADFLQSGQRNETLDYCVPGKIYFFRRNRRLVGNFDMDSALN